MKCGLEFITDQMVVGAFLPEEDQLLPGQRYRHDHVYIVGDKLEHTGLPWNKLAGYMEQLVAFIQQDSSINDLWKAALIHFYLAYLHPYFDGNGRMARLLHLWYLVEQGYSSTLFVPLPEYIERNCKKYYDAFSLAEQNARISGVLDLPPPSCCSTLSRKSITSSAANSLTVSPATPSAKHCKVVRSPKRNTRSGNLS